MAFVADLTLLNFPIVFHLYRGLQTVRELDHFAFGLIWCQGVAPPTPCALRSIAFPVRKLLELDTILYRNFIFGAREV